MKNKLLLFLLCFSNFSGICQVWNSLGSGVNGSVETFFVDNQNQLLVGGNFSSVDGSSIQGIAIWDSIQWVPFGNNARFSQFGGIYSIAIFNNDIVIGGRFDSINGVSIKNIARWDGTNWQPIGSGFNNSVLTIQVFNNELYAGGTFTFSGNDTVHYFGKWNGTTWESTVSGFGFNAPVYSSVIYENMLVIAGQFKLINNVVYGSIATWNDTLWTTLGNGFNNAVVKLRVINDTLYACGTFTQLPQNQCNYISKYDHTNWIQVTYPVGNTDWINDIVGYHNDLFVCGNFDNPEDLGIINGNVYDSVGMAFGVLKTMEVYKNQLYVGGDFTSIANLTTNSIARFDDISTGISDLLRSHDVSVYPNPAFSNSEIKINLLKKNYDSIVSIQIYSITGNLLYEFSWQEVYSLLDIQGGVYLVKVNFKNLNSSSQLLIIQ